MVICIEITDDSHPPSRRIQPIVIDLAREISQIPFFRVKIGLGRTYDQVWLNLILHTPINPFIHSFIISVHDSMHKIKHTFHYSTH